MTGLLKRLRKLEVTAAKNVDGPASWPAKEAAVKEYAMQRVSPADQVFLRELFASGNMTLQQEMIAKDPAVWGRFTEAFEWAVREVPAPYVMSVSDLFGQW
jgi:hypothetical protein